MNTLLSKLVGTFIALFGLLCIVVVFPFWMGVTQMLGQGTTILISGICGSLWIIGWLKFTFPYER